MIARNPGVVGFGAAAISCGTLRLLDSFMRTQCTPALPWWFYVLGVAGGMAVLLLPPFRIVRLKE